MFPHKYPFRLEEPIPPAWRVFKLERIRDKGLDIHYREPKWVKTLKDEGKELAKPKDDFKFPASRDPNPDHIRKRKTRLYPRITYDVTPARPDEDFEVEESEED